MLELAEVDTVDELLIVFNNFLTLANGGKCNLLSWLQGITGFPVKAGESLSFPGTYLSLRSWYCRELTQ